jgi:hypothetical protein
VQYIALVAYVMVVLRLTCQKNRAIPERRALQPEFAASRTTKHRVDGAL